VTRTGDSGSQAGEASDIDIARGSRFVTACRTGDGNLKLISWDITDAGAIPGRVTAGPKPERQPRSRWRCWVIDGRMPFRLRGTLPDNLARYTVRVLVDVDGDGRIGSGDYLNTESYPVLTRGYPDRVVIRVRKV
jgi:hypothetical protein